MVCSAKRRRGYRLARLQNMAAPTTRFGWNNYCPTAFQRKALGAGGAFGQEFYRVDLMVEEFFLESHEGTFCFPHLFKKLPGRLEFSPCIKRIDDCGLQRFDYFGLFDPVHLSVERFL
jgi:hypothetical protein